MSKVLELREKRAKAFLDTKRGSDGLLSAEDTETYEKMEKDVVDLGKEIERLERQAAIDAEHYRVLFRGQVYNITFLDNVKYRNKILKLRASLIKR